jgi:hypothetical protein
LKRNTFVVKIFQKSRRKVKIDGKHNLSKALEMIESLPEEQRESLIDIVRRRLIEERRDRLAQSIKEAKEEYKRGEIKSGSVNDLMDELSK